MVSVQDFSDFLKESVSNFLKFQPTLPVQKIPRVLHEPAILAGYRQTNQPWRYYLTSLFQIHNETFNVWSHLIGFVLVWILLAEYSENYDFLTDQHLWPMLAFGICCMIACMTSSSVHLLHSKSPFVHYNLFLIDYIGATMYSFGTGIMAFYSLSDKATYFYFENSYLRMLTFITWLNFVILCLAKILYGEDPYNLNRKVMQVGSMAMQALIVTLPFGPRYWNCLTSDICQFSSLNHITICYILFILQAFFFGSHMPEKLWPGRFDLLGHGHQIFHILSSLTQVMQFRAVLIDFKSGHSDHTAPDLVGLMSWLATLICADLITFLFVRRLIPRSEQKTK